MPINRQQHHCPITEIDKGVQVDNGADNEANLRQLNKNHDINNVAAVSMATSYMTLRQINSFHYSEGRTIGR